ncbi:3-hydroxyacyl-thioester dehydratase HtdZ [Virgisporangium ochraceum]|uniref:Putative enoyl-CoA hydratase 1 n=1 Tax=Virgisporangium ochraceum TaxID=65505 RepID=A0A8J4EFQ8_9ACTN|nr:MaoC family dehydratase [Virgisporangium ochraceum]GIJ72971.1 putative enoyl-CoA hydratase 1 [Virgisporangium ochraceum]
MTTVVFSDLSGLAGSDLGTSEWLEITQDRIDRFADATGDHQWIHVDPSRAATGPFGTTIAHGYLTLSLVIPLWTDLLRIEDVGMAVNYGLNKVRFPAPVPVGSKIRLAATVASVRPVAGNGVELVADLTVEIEGGPKPAAVAQAVYRYHP